MCDRFIGTPHQCTHSEGQNKIGSLLWQQQFAQGEFKNAITEIVAAFMTPELVVASWQMGHECKLPHVKQFIQRVLKIMLHFTLYLGGALTMMHLTYAVPPNCVFGLTERHGDNAQGRWLESVQCGFNDVETREHLAQKDAHL